MRRIVLFFGWRVWGLCCWISVTCGEWNTKTWDLIEMVGIDVGAGWGRGLDNSCWGKRVNYKIGCSGWTFDF